MKFMSINDSLCTEQKGINKHAVSKMKDHIVISYPFFHIWILYYDNFGMLFDYKKLNVNYSRKITLNN